MALAARTTTREASTGFVSVDASDSSHRSGVRLHAATTTSSTSLVFSPVKSSIEDSGAGERWLTCRRL